MARADDTAPVESATPTLDAMGGGVTPGGTAAAGAVPPRLDELVTLLETSAAGAATASLRGWASEWPDLVGQFVRSNPGHRFAPLALSALVAPRAAGVMATLAPVVSAGLLAASPDWGVPSLSKALGMLPLPKALAVFVAMDSGSRERLMLSGADWLRDQVLAILDSYWVQGLGVRLSGEVAATFGIPVKVGAGSFFELTNRGGGLIAAKGGGEASGGLASGYGGGAFLAAGGTEAGGLGAGMEAGLQGDLALRLLLEQQYEIDLFSGAQFVDVYQAIVTSTDVATTAERMANAFGTLDMTQYHRATKVEAMPGASGSASGEMGIRTATSKTASTSSTGDGRDAGKKTEWWQELTRAAGKAALAARMKVGLEVNTASWERVHGELVPSRMTVAVTGSAEALAKFSDALPGALAVLPPDVGLGAGGTLTFSARPAGGHYDLFDPVFEQHVSATLEDARARMSVAFEDLPKPQRESWQEYVGNLGAAKVSFELGLGSELLDRLIAAAMLELAGSVTPGLVKGSVAIRSSLDKVAVRRIVTTLLDEEDGDSAAEHVFERLGTFLTTRDVGPVMAAFDDIVQAVWEGVDRIDLRAEAGAAMRGGGGFAAGAKVSLDGKLGGSLLFQRELLSTYGEQPTRDEVRDLLLGNGATGGPLVDLGRYLG